MSDLIIFVDGKPRPLNATELAHHNATIEQAQIEVEAAEAKAAARQAALEKLGLTADQAAALFG